jgi:hypothetical protein
MAIEPLIIDLLARNSTDRAFKQVQANAQRTIAMSKQVGDYTIRWTESFNKSGKQVGNSLNGITKNLTRFRAEFLSIMFFGMAIQRTFGGLITSSVSTFQKVTEGTKDAANGFTQLNAATEFFKFSLAQALLGSPLFEQLLNIVLRLTDWWANLNDETKEFYASATLVAAAVGAILAAAGMIVLGLEGVDKVLGGVGQLRAGILKSIGIISIGFAIANTKEALSDIAKGNYVQGIFNALSAGFLAAGGVKFLQGKGGGWMIAVGILLDTDSLSLIWKSAKIIGNFLYAFFKTVGEQISAVLNNGIVGGITEALDVIAAALKTNPITYVMGLGISKMANSLREMYDIKDFSFGDQFKKNYELAAKMGQGSDGAVEEILRNINEGIDYLANGKKEDAQGGYTPIVQQNNYYGVTSIEGATMISQRNLETEMARTGQAEYSYGGVSSIYG